LPGIVQHPSFDIPFSIPYTGEEEEKALSEAVYRDPLHGNGPTGRQVEQYMQEWLGVSHVFLTTSCSHALEMAVMSLELEEGDEVIMPSFNFVSSANAVSLREGVPVFAEVNRQTMNIDPVDVERKITDRTKAVIPVHYAGVGAEMDELADLGRRHNLWIVEDSAQALDASYKGQYLGTIGNIGCYSFHDTKNIMCGEGGALVTDNDEVARTVELIREKGTNRMDFKRGEVDKYSWVRPGSSYVLSDLQASMLQVQLEKRDEIKQKRKNVWQAYAGRLRELEEEGFIQLQQVPESRDQNYHMFFFLARSGEEQSAILKTLRSEGIEAQFHYVPLHRSPYGRRYGEYDLPVTESHSSRLIRLPLYPQLADRAEEVADSIAALIKQTVE
jgi:dTDP-4-amino-4,6-dideoxygalactose transaminase